MTCVAYRAGSLAAESRLGCGTSLNGEIEKSARAKDGAIGGACGDAVWAHAFLSWLKGGRLDERPKPGEGDAAILIHPDGRLEAIESTGSFFPAADYWAIGCGRGVALGAMFVGADAETAVRAACAHDAFCGGTIRVLKLGKGVDDGADVVA